MKDVHKIFWMAVVWAAMSGMEVYWHEYGRATFFGITSILFGMAYLGGEIVRGRQ